jgi:homoserine dehydrogenase
MSDVKIGIAGLGVVGGGLLDILLNRTEKLARLQSAVRVAAVSARNKSSDRGVTLDGIAWFDDPVAMANSDDIDIFVELIGGSDGVARASVEAALANGKHVVTANKALIAAHGRDLAAMAEKNGVSLSYEAAVAGGIPAIRGLREGCAASSVSAITAILNGTCNYILTEMEKTGAPYEEVLKDAQNLGYAEADPSFDVGGIDAAHKLAILAMIAFDADVNFDDLTVQGIERITAEDIQAAGKLGYKIRLLAIARAYENGLQLRVHPSLVLEDHPAALAEGPNNLLIIDSEPLGRISLTGPGAGAGATAAAVAADIIAITRGARGPAFNTPSSALRNIPVLPVEHQDGCFYMRVMLHDVPGAIAGITETLARYNISIDSLLQPSVERTGTDKATVVLTTHTTTLHDINAAASDIAQKPFASGTPSIMRIVTVV